MDVVVGALKTPTGRAAIARAVAEAELLEATVHLVGFVPAPRDKTAARAYQEEVKTVARELEDLAPELVRSAVPVRVHVPSGFSRPSDAVINVADQVDADLIVIGLRGRSRVGKALLGSNAQDILLRAECAVLTVPSPTGANW